MTMVIQGLFFSYSPKWIDGLSGFNKMDSNGSALICGKLIDNNKGIISQSLVIYSDQIIV